MARSARAIASDARQRQRYGTQVEKLPSVWLNFSDPFLLQVQLRTGSFLWDVSAGKWVSGDGADVEKLIDRPFLVGVTCDLAEKNVGTWVSEMFKWTPPRIVFAPSEQRLLVAPLSKVQPTTSYQTI